MIFPSYRILFRIVSCLFLSGIPSRGFPEILLEPFAYAADTTIVEANGGTGFGGPWVQHAHWPTDQGAFLRVTEPSLLWPEQNIIGGHLRFHGGNGSYRQHVVRRPLAAALAPGDYVLSFVYQNSNPSASGSSSDLAFRGTNDTSLRVTLYQSTQLLINGNETGLQITPNTPQLIQLRLILNGPGQSDSLSLWLNPEPGTMDAPGYTSNSLDFGSPNTLEISAWGNQTIGWDSVRLLTTEAFLNPPPQAPVVQERDPWQWPFARNSIWNTPRGADAQLVPANLPLTFDGGTPYLGLDLERHVKVTDDAPLRPIYPPRGEDWPYVWPGNDAFAKPNTAQWADLPLPDDFLKADNNPPHTPNGCTTFLMPDGRTLRQMQPTVRLWDDAYPDRRIVGWPAAPVDLYGPGITGSHFGSGLSTLGGSLRVGELSSPEPIRHALKLNIWVRHLHYGESKGFRWPADRADSYASPETYTGTNPALQMGALLVLPANVTPEALNITSAPALKIFAALRDYGCYISDDTAWNAYDFCAEEGVVAEVAAMGHTLGGYHGQLNEELKRIINALHVVNDNSPQTPGGAGPRMAPLAPRLVDPIFTQPLQVSAEREEDAVLLSWSGPASWLPHSYELQRKLGDNDWEILGHIDSESFTDTPGSPDQALRYRIRGIDSGSSNAGTWAEIHLAARRSDYEIWLQERALTDGQMLTLGGHVIDTWSAFVMGADPEDTTGSSLLRAGGLSSEVPDRIPFEGIANRVYRLQHTGDLTTSDWQTLGEPLTGEGPLFFMIPPVAAPGFFRLTVEPAAP